MDGLTLEEALPRDAERIAALRRSVADDLTLRFGRGHWSREASDRGVLSGMRHGRVFVARGSTEVLGVLGLAQRKPWAIDARYSTPAIRPLYLTDLAVGPGHQRAGVGRWLVQRALEVARGWPADAVRLDAYDAEAGAGAFYARCGFREVGRATYRGTPLIYYERVLEATGS